VFTLYHAPQSRSTRLLALLHAMEVRDRIDLQVVGIRRDNGTGARDPRNPHPEGRVPLLDTGGTLLRESNAIILFLTDHFDSALGRPVGHAQRADYLFWLSYYGNVMEPVALAGFGGVGETPALVSGFGMAENVAATLGAALADAPYLLGQDYSAADALVVSMFHFAPFLTPDVAAVRDWVARCADHPSLAAAAAEEAAMPMP